MQNKLKIQADESQQISDEISSNRKKLWNQTTIRMIKLGLGILFFWVAHLKAKGTRRYHPDIWRCEGVGEEMRRGGWVSFAFRREETIESAGSHTTHTIHTIKEATKHAASF